MKPLVISFLIAIVCSDAAIIATSLLTKRANKPHPVTVTTTNAPAPQPAIQPGSIREVSRQAWDDGYRDGAIRGLQAANMLLTHELSAADASAYTLSGITNNPLRP